MLLYFGGYTISANRMAPKNSTELLHSIRIKNLSIKVKLEMFFLLPIWSLCVIRTMNESFTHVQRYIVAVIKPPVTWQIFDLPGWQILSCDRSKIEHERRMSHLVPKKKSQSCIFNEPNYIFIHTLGNWTSHIGWHCGPLHWIKKGPRRREKT